MRIKIKTPVLTYPGLADYKKFVHLDSDQTAKLNGLIVEATETPEGTYIVLREHFISMLEARPENIGDIDYWREKLKGQIITFTKDDAEAYQ